MPRQNTIYKVITLPDGSRKWIYAKTEEELRRKLLDYQVQLSMGIDLANKDTFGEYAEMWYRTYKAPFVRDNTKQSILNSLNNHILPFLSGYKMRDIQPIHIQCVFNALVDYSVSLNQKVKAVLGAILNTAVENNVIRRSPMVKTIQIGGVAAKEKDALTTEESEALLSALSGSSNQGVKNCRLFCLLALKTGLRRGELCALMWNDISFENAELTVRKNCTWANNTGVEISENLKTSAARRTVPIPTSALQALKAERMESNSLYVFHRRDGQPITKSAFRKMWEHTRKAKLDADITPHVLRHTYCTRLFEAGLDIKEIQYLMGHADPEMTLRVYTHYIQKKRFVDTSARIRAAL